MARAPLIAGIVRIAVGAADRAVAAAERARVELRPAPRAPLTLVVRAATSIVGRLETRTFSGATPAQQVVLGAAAAQIRAAAGSILVSSEGALPGSVESSLGELVARTLALVDEAMVPPPTLESRAPTPVRALGQGEKLRASP